MQNDGSFVTAIHVCVYLDLNSGLQSSRSIAESIGTNPVLVRRLIVKMKGHGILKVVRGKMGGCELARSSNSITLWDVFLAMRRDQHFKVRVRNTDDPVALSLPAVLEPVFAEAEYAMKLPLSAKTIKQLSVKSLNL